ncbi:MAG: sodium-dependent bicarbonate transport family permease [Ahrensia sp.]|nr:sodium-dependent bicarbonate transport family permease [Ahrensia sp.]
METALATILSPIILFFVLGLLASLLRSQMSVPEAFAKGLAIYLMMAIGLKGGVEMSTSTLSGDVVAMLLAGIALSFALPVLAYRLLIITTKLDPVDAAAVGAHYGSISIVTFVAATEAVRLAGIGSSGHLVAVAALMETPAIIAALLLLQKTQKVETQNREGALIAGAERGELVREVLLNASVVVLIGALLIGWISGEAGMEKVEGFFVTPFQGVLCLFLLDMGLNAGRGLRQGWRKLDAGTILFGLYMPLVSASIAALVCLALGAPQGDATLLITLAASASYIAVPAAMRLALPKANPSIYLTLSLGITFPFNVTLGIPVYIYLAGLVGG